MSTIHLIMFQKHFNTIINKNNFFSFSGAWDGDEVVETEPE